MSKPFPAFHCFPPGPSGNLEPWCFFGSSLGGQRCPGTSKEQVEPLMPSPSAAFTLPPLPHWPPHVLGGWAGGVEWSQEANGPKAVGRSLSSSTAKFCLQRCHGCPLPAVMLILSNVQMGKQNQSTCPKILSFLREVDLLSPSGVCPSDCVDFTWLLPTQTSREGPCLTSSDPELMAQSWVGLFCSYYSMNELWRN